MDRRSFLKGLVKASVAGSVSARAGAMVTDNLYLNHDLGFSIAKPERWIYYHPTDFEILVMKENGALEDPAKFDWHQECVGTPALVVSNHPEALLHEAAVGVVLVDDPGAYSDHAHFLSCAKQSSASLSMVATEVDLIDDGRYHLRNSDHVAWSFSAAMTHEEGGACERVYGRYLMCLSAKADLTFVFVRPLHCSPVMVAELQSVVDSVQVF